MNPMTTPTLNIPYPRLTQRDVEVLFARAGFEVVGCRPLIDGYGYSPDDDRYYTDPPRCVWWFVKTRFGWIEIGWRKRVIAIDWRDTPARLIVTTDDTTKDECGVHAWRPEQALEYLTTLRVALESEAPKPDLDQIIPLMTALVRKLREKVRPDYFYLSCNYGGYESDGAAPSFRFSTYVDGRSFERDCATVADLLAAVDSLSPVSAKREAADRLRADIASKQAALAALEAQL